MIISVVAFRSSREMAARGGGAGPAQRPNGIPREKVCQFKLVLLGKLRRKREVSICIVHVCHTH